MIDWDKVKSPCLQKCRAISEENRKALSEMPKMSLLEMAEETHRFMGQPPLTEEQKAIYKE